MFFHPDARYYRALRSAVISVRAVLFMIRGRSRMPLMHARENQRAIPLDNVDDKDVSLPPSNKYSLTSCYISHSTATLITWRDLSRITMPSSLCAKLGHLSSLSLSLSLFSYFLAFGITGMSDEATDDYNQTSRVWLADFRDFNRAIK